MGTAIVALSMLSKLVSVPGYSPKLVMDTAGIYQMGTFLLVEALQIRDMLEVVSIELTGLYYFIGLYIIIKYLNLQSITLLL